MTVCQDSDVPIDPMAPIFRYLMPLKYSCERNPDIYLDGYANCSSQAEPLRKKFGFLFDAAFDLVQGEIERLYNEGKEQQKIPPKLYQNLEKRAKMIDQLLAQNITTSKAMTVHVRSLFARCSNFDYLWFIRDLVRGMPESKIATNNITASLEARKLAAIVTFSLTDIGSFGAFVTELIPLVERFFSRTIAGKPTQLKSWFTMHDLFRDIANEIASLRKTPNQRKVQFETASLFEIPDRVSLKSAKYLRYQVASELPQYAFGLPQGHLTSSLRCFRELKVLLDHEQTRATSVKKIDCPVNVTKTCCDSADLLSVGNGGLPTIMQIMRWSKHRGQDLLHLTGTIKVASSLGYSTFELGDGPMKTDTRYLPQGKDPFTMIPLYEFGFQGSPLGNRLYTTQDRGPKPVLFEPVVTDSGICQGFNSPSVTEMFDKSTFLNTFMSVFHEDLLDNHQLHQAQPFSVKKGLEFLLDRQMMFRNFWNGSSYRLQGNYVLSFNDPNYSVNVRAKLRPVHLGHHITFLLTPLVLSSDKSLRHLPVKSRNCFFPDESLDSVSLFKRYSQGRCFFQCMLELARESCNCGPWDFPFANNWPQKQVCNPYGYFCFDDILSNDSYRLTHCQHCLPDCDVVDYQVSQTVIPLDHRIHCRVHEVQSKQIMQYGTYVQTLYTVQFSLH